MRRFTGPVLAAVLALAAPHAWAETLAFPFGPTAGTQWVVSHRLTRQGQNDSAPVEIRSTALLKVISVTANGYTFEWTGQTISGNGMTFDAGSVDPNILIGLPIRFVADVDGSPISINDVDALVASFMDIVRSSSSRPDEKTLSAAQQMFKRTDPETLASILLREATAIASCQHLEADTARPIVAQGMTPQLAGGEPILTNFEIRLVDRGGPDRPAKIVTKQSFDPESATRSMTALMKDLAKQRGEAASAPVPTIQRDITTTCSIDTKTGDAVSVVVEMLARGGGEERRDRRELSIRRK